jgi:hypothetical protein
MKKFISYLYYIICTLPFIYIILFYSYVLRAFIKLGYFPEYNNPDPKELGFDIHHDLIYLIGDIVIYGFLGWLVLSIMNKFKYPRWTFVLYGLGMAFFMYILAIDPFMEWFAD